MVNKIKVSCPNGPRGGMIVVERVPQSKLRTLEDGTVTTSVTLEGKTVRVIKAKKKRLFTLA